MKTIFSIIIVVFLFFYNALTNVISLPEAIKYWDEFVVIFLLIYVLFKKSLSDNNHIKTDIFLSYILIVFLIISGLLSNRIYKYNSNASAIFRDIIQFLKFPLSVLIMKDTDLDKKIMTIFDAKITKKILKVCTIIIFSLGVISIFKNIGMSMSSVRNGINPYKFLFSHPTYLVLCCVMLICYFKAFCSDNSKLYILLLMVSIVLAMRTKGLIFIAVYIFFKYTGKWVKKFKILYWILIVAVMYGVAYKKLQLYDTYTTSAREVLYKESINFSKKCIPLGTGFATYGSHLSWKYKSRIYDLIKIPFYEVKDGNPAAVLGDAGYSYYIGQFGVLGIVLLVLLGKHIYKISTIKVDKTCKLAITLLYIYILVALTSETTLVNNGIELAVMISAISYKGKTNTEVLE